MPYFVKVVLVQLANEAGKVRVLEVFLQTISAPRHEATQAQRISMPAQCSPYRQNVLGKLLILQHHEAVALVSPPYYTFVLRVLQHLVQLANLERISNCLPMARSTRLWH